VIQIHNFLFPNFVLWDGPGPLTNQTATSGARALACSVMPKRYNISYCAEECHGEWVIVHRVTTNDSFPAASWISQNAKNSAPWHQSRRIWCGRGIQITHQFVFLNIIWTLDFHTWVPVTTAWRVVRLRMEERRRHMEDSCRIYWISRRGQPSRGGSPPGWVGRGANNSSP
jgi:hypothetical protein